MAKMPIMAPQGQGPFGGKSRCLFGIQPVAPTRNSGRARILAIVAPDPDLESRRRLVGASSTSCDCEWRFSRWERYVRSSSFGRGKTSYERPSDVVLSSQVGCGEVWRNEGRQRLRAYFLLGIRARNQPITYASANAWKYLSFISTRSA